MRGRPQLALLLLLLLILPAGRPGSAAAATVLVVADFVANGPPPSAGDEAARIVRERLAAAPGLIVLDRSRLEAYGARLRAALRSGDDALARVGRLMGARYVLVGSVGLLGSDATLEARLVDVESAVSIASWRGTANGGLPGLPDAARETAERILVELTGSRGPTLPPPAAP